MGNSREFSSRAGCGAARGPSLGSAPGAEFPSRPFPRCRLGCRSPAQRRLLSQPSNDNRQPDRPPRAPIAAHTRRCAMRELRSRPRGRRSLCEAPAGAPAPRCSHIRQNFPAFSPKRRQLLRKRASRSAHFPSGPFENGSISGYRALGGNPKGRAGRQQRAAIHRGSQRS